MPSLINIYKSKGKGEKGIMLSDLARATGLKYPTVREKIVSRKFPDSFKFSEQKLIADHYNMPMEELFPSSVLVAN